MYPALKAGQDVLVWCWFYKPKRGDIVVIRHRGKEMIKRIKKNYGNNFVVEGDNRRESTDSRQFGLIPGTEIVGKVVYVR